MPPRSSWKGFLRLSLVSVPVKAYTAASSSRSDVTLNQLHAECNNRIQYRKTCPVHGEVSNDEIVSGYEFAKGQYVVITPEEIEKVRPQGDKSITIDSFIKSTELDAVYYDKTYYLVPDGPIGERPYLVLRDGMAEQDRCAIAQVVISNREQTVLLRPLNGLLAMTTLRYDDEVKKPESFADEIPKIEVSKEEIELAEQLIEAKTAKKFDFSAYKDLYTQRLTAVIQAKVEGKEITSPQALEEPQVINLMDALRESVAKAQEGKPVKKPKKKMAPSKSARAPAKKKRKTS